MMRVVNTGNTYRIYDDSLKTYEKLPVQTYLVCFNEMTGFYLDKYSDISVDEKVYGTHLSKVDKVLKAFSKFDRSLGVILSGAKGIGKSLCAKLLSERAVTEGYPVIIVNSYFQGIADYLTSIEQEVVILFDEFDKTYRSDSKNDQNDPQTEMLTLFDGLSQGKKLFVVTCNELSGLNNYLVNRPGRFHYHFRFDHPTNAEIREYLQDKIECKYYPEIEKVVSFSSKVDLNYDCLRAIAFELSAGVVFEDAIKDLNIVNVSREEYTLMAFFKNGSKGKKNVFLDMFTGEDERIELEDEKGFYFYVDFNPCDGAFDHVRGGIVFRNDQVAVDWQESYYDNDEAVKERSKRELDFLLIRRKQSKGIHYAL